MTDTDHCKACGSDDLFSGFFGRDGLATDGRGEASGSKWRTVCNRCGHFQHRRVPKVATTFRVGERVQTHPATDAWMRGLRYGIVVAERGGQVHLMMDRTGKVIRLDPSNVMHLVA